MAEAADFELRLINSVTGPAKQAADALRNVEAMANRAQDALSRRSAGGGRRGGADTAERDIRRMGLAQVQAAAMDMRMKERAAAAAVRAKAREEAATRRLGLAQLEAMKMNEKFDKARRGGGGFFSSFRTALPFRSIGDYAKGAFWGTIAANATMSVVGSFVEGAKAAVGLITHGVKVAFEEGGKAEKLRLSYKLLLGAQGGAALEDIGRFSKKTQYDDDRIAEMMRPLFNAGLRGQAARSVFAASGDLEAAGLGSAQEFIDQFAKIQLKGGISEKLLVGMGVSIRDFKDALAKETKNKDKEAAFKKATEGKGDPQAIMNAIFSGIEKRQGGMLGTGTVAASQTMSARVGKVFDLPAQYLKRMSESPSWNTLSDRLGEVLEALDPAGERGQAIISRLFAMFDRLVTALDQFLQPANLDAFVAKLNDVLDGIGAVANFVAHPLDSLVSGVDALATPEHFKQMEAAQNAEAAYASIREQLNSDAPQARPVTAGLAKYGGSLRSLTVNGGISLNLPPGVDGEKTAAEFYKALDRKQHAGMGRAATEGGG